MYHLHQNSGTRSYRLVLCAGRVWDRAGRIRNQRIHQRCC